MTSIIIDILFAFLLFISVGAYVIGKNRKIFLLKAVGIRSSFVMFLMLVLYTWMIIKRDYS